MSQPAEAIAAAFDLDEVPAWEPRYNIAPTQMVPTIVMDNSPSPVRTGLTGQLGDQQMDGKNPPLQPQTSYNRHFRLMRWGLIPSWAKDPAMGARMINARAETVTEKPSFRNAFRRRRCLIVADGFYEWQRQAGKKQPFYFRLQDGQPFGFAGLWERWESADGEVISCTILTTEANDLLRPIHDRMPVILDSKDYSLWLDPEMQQAEPLQNLLRPYQTEAMTSYPVSTLVNNPANNSPECINSF